MEAKVSEILENILGLLALEGSFEVVEGSEEVTVTIQTDNPGRLIGFRGETLDALQLIVNLIMLRQSGDEEKDSKRIVIDVEGWRKNKEADLERRARGWIEEVVESGEEIELEPMPSWQRRIVHLIASENEKVETESMGEGRDRHLVIRPAEAAPKKTKSSKKDKTDSAKATPVKEEVEEVAETEVGKTEEAVVEE